MYIGGTMSWKKSFYILKLFKNQRLTLKELKKLQFKKLKSIIQYAYDNSEFYRKKFDEAGFNPTKFNSLEDIKKIPITTKEEVRDISKMLIGKYNPKKHHIFTTSGSTGEPLRIIHNNRNIDYTTAGYAKFLFSIGAKPWDKVAFYRSEDVDFRKATTFTYHKLRLVKKEWVDPTKTSEQQLHRLEQIEPNIIVGYPYSLKLIGDFIKKHTIKPKIKLKLIVSHTEILTEETRRYLEKIFRCPVFNWYSSTEFMGMAGECKRRKGLHIEADTVYIEAIKNGKSVYNELAPLICTSLENYTMPLIRYEIGDLGVLSKEKCSCGRNSPLLKSIEGRNEDLLITSDGSKLSPRMVATKIYYAAQRNDQITTFKVIQKKQNLILVKVVKGPNYNYNTPTRIKEILYDLLANTKIDIENVQNIEKEKSGKFRHVVSQIQNKNN